MFYLKTINWNNFARDIGYIQLVENPKYDYALSFAGQDRDFVESIFKKLEAEEVAVFYDKNEQAEILSRNVEEYLYPIYNSEAAYVVVFLSRHYPERIWARFESNAFKERFGKDSVIPIWFESAGDNAFDITKDYGGITYHDQDMENQEREINNIVSVLLERIKLYRIG